MVERKQPHTWSRDFHCLNVDLDSPVSLLEAPQFGGTCCFTPATAAENTTENPAPFAASFLEHRVCYHSLEKQDGTLVWEKNQFAIRLEINCKHVEEIYFFFPLLLCLFFAICCGVRLILIILVELVTLTKLSSRVSTCTAAAVVQQESKLLAIGIQKRTSTL